MRNTAEAISRGLRIYIVDAEPLQEMDRWFGLFRRHWEPKLEALATEIARANGRTSGVGKKACIMSRWQHRVCQHPRRGRTTASGRCGTSYSGKPLNWGSSSLISYHGAFDETNT